MSIVLHLIKPSRLVNEEIWFFMMNLKGTPYLRYNVLIESESMD